MLAALGFILCACASHSTRNSGAQGSGGSPGTGGNINSGGSGGATGTGGLTGGGTTGTGGATGMGGTTGMGGVTGSGGITGNGGTTGKGGTSGTGSATGAGGTIGAGGVLGTGGTTGTSARTWVHPGTLDGKAELDYVKTQIGAGAEPWTRQMNSMKNIEKLTMAPTPQTTIDANSGAADAARDDARRAYGNALAWYLTGQDSYAQQAVAYLNAWSGLQSITATNEQNRLAAGWLGSLFGPAADLMLGYAGWAAADVAKSRAMFKRAFYPLLNTASTWNGNVDLHQICAMMAIAVFNEDETEFNLGLSRLEIRVPAYFYLVADGTPPSIAGDGGNVTTFWSSPTKWVDGLTQETCRDNNHHAQFGMSGALGAMETAWHQGMDVYAKHQTRMVAVMELMGLQCTSGKMQGTCSNDQTTADVYDTWEIGYNHFHTRKGIAMPNTWAMISPKVRNYESNPGSWNIFYETLTHADIKY
jgi:hypothetical protein